jgi:hypothetical protein
LINKSDYNSICSVCGDCGDGNIKRRAPLVLEIVVWLVALNWLALIYPVVGAILFSCWARLGSEYVCNLCDGKVIPISSPVGEELFNKYHSMR